MKSIEVSASAGAVERVLADYEAWLVAERSLAARTVANYLDGARWFAIEQLGGDHERLVGVTAADVSSAVLSLTPRYSPRTVNEFVVQLRAFLRYLHLTGLIESPLAQAVPWLARARASSLPRTLPPGRAEQLLASCDRGSLVGARDFAVLTVLVRLGLRRSEVASLQLSDVDWRRGELAVRGKGGSLDVLPLPADVGEAIAAYLQLRGGDSGCRSLFAHVQGAPRGVSATGVSAVVRRACRRAGVADVGTHRLRHGLASKMLRRGAPLHEIGELLRHREVETTAMYARVDLAALATVARPWPGAAR